MSAPPQRMPMPPTAAQAQGELDWTDISAPGARERWERLLDAVIERKLQAGRMQAFYERPAHVVPKLFLGNMSHAGDVQRLAQLDIKNIANCAFEALGGAGNRPGWYPADWGFVGFPAHDVDEYPILERHLDECLAFVRTARAKNEAVLIHCMAGMNRSAALLVGVLLHEHDMDLITAIRTTARARGIILTNDGFKWQLVQLAHKMGKLRAPTPASGDENDLIKGAVEQALSQRSSLW